MAAMREQKTGAFLSANAVLKGLVAALIITVIGCALMGTAYHLTSLSEASLPRTSASLFYFSIFAGSIVAAKEAAYKGFLHGVMVALMFVLISWLVAKFFMGLGVGFIYTIKKALISIVSGAIGGILGVGLSR
ncbi:TIGR04086 family membrane protein [Desulfotruncus alcoholivorax]|uniref:TIGR04086 family membrane protein n=1 Tax=Desulfotruncus alcoholivorax TaxID=265477 RepID=UPI000425863A|nr:TIGR04086 family membrane protein [Desulfotruncus alcoholivorax]